MNCTINKTLSDVDGLATARHAEDKLRAVFNKHLGLLVVLRNDVVDWPFVKGLLLSREYPKQASVCYVQALRDRFADIIAAIHKLQTLGAEVDEELRSTTQVVTATMNPAIGDGSVQHSSSCRSTPIMTPIKSPGISPPRSHLTIATAKGCQTEWCLMKATNHQSSDPQMIVCSPEPLGRPSPIVKGEALLSQTEDLLVSPLMNTPRDCASNYASPLDATLVDICPPTRANVNVGGEETQILTTSQNHRASQTRRSLIAALNSTLRESFGDFLRGGSSTKKLEQESAAESLLMDDSATAEVTAAIVPPTTPSGYIDEFPETGNINDFQDSCWPEQRASRLSDGGPAAKRRKNAQDFATFLDESAFMNCLNFSKYPSKMLKLICDELGLKNTTKKETVKQLEAIRDAIRMRYFENVDDPCP